MELSTSYYKSLSHSVFPGIAVVQSIGVLVLFFLLPAPLSSTANSSYITAEQIRRLIQTGNLDSAQKLLSDALTEYPTDANLHNLEGVIEVRRNNYKAAKSSFLRAIKEAPRLSGPYLNLGHLYLQYLNGEPDALRKALNTYNSLLNFDPDNVEANYQSAFILFHLGSFQESLKRLSRLPRTEQERSQALSVRCGDYAGLGERARARELANQMLSSQNLAEADVLTIVPVLDSHQCQEIAVQLLEGLRSRGFASFRSLHTLGMLYLKQGKLSEARSILENAAEDQPSSVPLLIELARISYGQKDYKGSLGYLAHARQLSPQNSKIYFLWGMTCIQLNLGEEAYRALKKAVRLDPDNPYYNYALGAVAIVRTDASEAIPYFQKYCKLKPHDPRGRLALGAAYFHSHSIEKAKKILLQITGYRATAPGVHYYLGRIANDEGNLGTAVRELEMAIKYDPQYAQAYAELGVVHLKQKEYDQAARSLRKALQLNPDSYTANLNLMILYERTKDSRATAQTKRFNSIRQQRAERTKEFLRTIEVRP